MRHVPMIASFAALVSCSVFLNAPVAQRLAEGTNELELSEQVYANLWIHGSKLRPYMSDREILVALELAQFAPAAQCGDFGIVRWKCRVERYSFRDGSHLDLSWTDDFLSRVTYVSDDRRLSLYPHPSSFVFE